MRIYLFNDTSAGHAGSQETTRNLYEILTDHEIIDVHKVGQFDYSKESLRACDAVVMNGEGSIHHGNEKSCFLMRCLRDAQAFGKKTYLVNTTYQDMPDKYDLILSRLTYLAVREYASYQYIIKKNIRCELFIDLSINNLEPRQGASVGKKRIIGEAHPDVEKSCEYIKSLSGERRTLNQGTFQETVSYLYHNAKTFITGQYHGIIAGLYAGCYVVPVPSNSWKIEGLMMWAKINKMHPKELLITAPRLSGLPT